MSRKILNILFCFCTNFSAKQFAAKNVMILKDFIKKHVSAAIR